MAFDSTLATPLTSTKALQADQSDPDRLLFKLSQRSNQAQTLANRSEAGAPQSELPTADTLAGDVIGAATEAAFSTTTPLFKPADDGTRADIEVGTRFKVRAFCSVTTKNAADTLTLSIRVGDDSTPANNTLMTATNATNCAADDVIILESEGMVGELGADGFLLHYSWNVGDNNFAGASPGPALVSFGAAEIDTDDLGLQPNVTVTGSWSSANATNIVKLESLEVQCVAQNEALTFE